MELREVVRRRRMVRRFDVARGVDEGVLERVLVAATSGPTAGGSQGRELLVLTDVADRDAFWRAASDDVDAPDRWLAGMLTAPVLVLCLAAPGAYRERYARPDKARAAAERAAAGGGWPVPWWDVDTGMAALLLLLAAVDERLGACLTGVPAPRWDAVRAALGVPADRRPVALVALGHPDPAEITPAGASRRPALAAVVSRGRHGRAWGSPAPS